MKLALIIATIRNVDFLLSWHPLLSKDVTIFVVEDRREKLCKLPKDFDHVRHYCWKDIDADLGERAWIIPRQTSAIKSYGFYKAWQEGFDIIACLDDDCYPEDLNWEKRHIQVLTSKCHPASEPIFNTTFGLYPRGFPFGARTNEREIVLNVGGWTENPDIDARTELSDGLPKDWWCSDAIVPYGVYFPMCGMNIAFKREIAPIMYFGLQGKNYKYDRYDDIWCGLFAKSIIDGMGKAVHIGSPLIRHSRASNPVENFKKEEKGYDVLESLYKRALYNPLPCCANWKEGMIQMADRISKGEIYNAEDYFKKLADAILVWVSLYI